MQHWLGDWGDSAQDWPCSWWAWPQGGCGQAAHEAETGERHSNPLTTISLPPSSTKPGIANITYSSISPRDMPLSPAPKDMPLSPAPAAAPPSPPQYSALERPPVAAPPQVVSEEKGSEERIYHVLEERGREAVSGNGLPVGAEGRYEFMVPGQLQEEKVEPEYSTLQHS